MVYYTDDIIRMPRQIVTNSRERGVNIISRYLLTVLSYRSYYLDKLGAGSHLRCSTYRPMPWDCPCFSPRIACIPSCRISFQDRAWFDWHVLNPGVTAIRCQLGGEAHKIIKTF